ncbi:MAG: substrate-binding domain-containing protein [Mangrovicoccus sp.]
MTLDPDAFLTTKEVADLLRVKERKVYDLAAAGEIPHRRITGKLLFPRTDLTAWLKGDEAVSDNQAPMVLAGSHDPLLDWALRASGSGLASFYDGSGDGLRRFCDGQAAAAGMHLPEDGRWNLASVQASAPKDAVLLGWARRVQGLILPQGSMVARLSDLLGERLALRQEGSGARGLFDQLAREEGLEPSAFEAQASLARTETEAAAAVAGGEVAAALGLEAMSRQYRLGFVPLATESFDILINRRAYFSPAWQTLWAFTKTPEFAERAESLGGYDLQQLGQVRWLSP